MPVYANLTKSEAGVIEFSANLKNVDRDTAANYDFLLFDKALKFAENEDNQRIMQYINENAQTLHNSKSQLVLQDAYEKIKQIPKEDIEEDAVGDEYAKQAAQSKVKGMIKLKEKRIEEKKAGRNTISANSVTFNEGI